MLLKLVALASERTGAQAQQLRGAGPGAGAWLSVTRKAQQVEGGSHWTQELAVLTEQGTLHLEKCRYWHWPHCPALPGSAGSDPMPGDTGPSQLELLLGPSQADRAEQGAPVADIVERRTSKTAGLLKGTGRGPVYL